jgi:hypothetical protein
MIAGTELASFCVDEQASLPSSPFLFLSNPKLIGRALDNELKV